MDRARRVLLWVLAVVGANCVVLQFWINMTRHPEHTLLWRLVDFFSYFTNTTGIFATAAAVAALAHPNSRRAWAGVTAAAVYLVVVAVTYQWLLRGETSGLAFVANVGLHQMLPALFVLLWLAAPRPGPGWRAPLAWLIYPAAYIAWILAHGAVAHRYPYFFADADKLGYPRALLNGAGFLAAFYVLGLGAVAVGRLPLAARSGRALETPQAS